MGIKQNFLKFVKKKCVDVEKIYPLSNIKNSVICIDTPCIVYKYKCSYYDQFNKNNWINGLIYFILKLFEYNIDCVFIFEGISPIEKLETQLSRLKIKNNIKNRTHYMNSLIEQYYQDNIVSNELRNEWEILLKNGKVKNDFDIVKFKQVVNHRENYMQDITKEDYIMLEEFLDVMNISKIHSISEAETLCSYFESNKKVSYILSKDSDIIVYRGVSGFINNIDISKETYSYISKNKILEGLSFDEDMLLDFCIMCGTDYNKSIPKIGINTSFKLINKYKSIEKITEVSEESKKILNVDFNRNKFNLTEFKDEIIIDHKWLNITISDLNKLLIKYAITLNNNILEMLKKNERN